MLTRLQVGPGWNGARTPMRLLTWAVTSSLGSTTSLRLAPLRSLTRSLSHRFQGGATAFFTAWHWLSVPMRHCFLSSDLQRGRSKTTLRRRFTSVIDLRFRPLLKVAQPHLPQVNPVRVSRSTPLLPPPRRKWCLAQQDCPRSRM
jgi:hypothetical protein